MEVEEATSANKLATTWEDNIKRKWKKRSRLEKQLLVALVIVVLILVGLLLFIIITHAVAPKKCETSACLQAAARIVTHIDPKVDPCEDFFKFACGKFIESTHGDTKAATVMTIKAQVDRQLDEIIKEPIMDDDHYLLKSEKELYQACLNETVVEEESLDTFMKILDKLQGWPVTLGFRWDDRLFDWKEMVYVLRSNGYAYGMILPVGITEDPKNSDRYIVTVSPPYPNKVKHEHKQLYIKYMTDIAVLLGADRNRATLEMERVLDFMENLKKIVDKHELEEDANMTAEMLETRFTIPEYEALNGQIHWLDYINNILYPVGQISNDDYVIFPKVEVVKDLFDLLHKTQRRTQANYIIWTVIESIMPYMTKEIKERNSNYTCLTKTSPKPKERSKYCQGESRHCFNPSPSLIVYARRYLPQNQRNQVKEMVDNIKTEFKLVLEKTSWMDAESKGRALEKANNIIEIVGAPRDYFNDAAFEQFPPGGTNFEKPIENGTLFEMVLSHRKKLADAHYFRIHMSVKDNTPEKFYDYVSYVDAMFSPPDNAMILPVGILQDIFYDAQRPMYLNYGAIGGIIGHELTHGFAEMGSKYDKDGYENTIWSQKTKKAYEDEVKCIVDEADSFELDEADTSINGTATLEENIADYAGLKVAYAAYQKWVDRNGEEPYLTGIEYTPNQLFWISSISYECFKIDNKMSKKGDRHAHNSFRGTGPVRNNLDFARDFNCPIGSRMNPSEKCQVF